MGRPSGDRIMSNGIAPLASLQGPEPAAPTGARSGGKPSGTPFTPTEATPTPAPLRPNPSFRIDAALGLVVLQLRDAAGGASSTIPTTQQLEAYRRAAGIHHAASTEAGTDPGNPADNRVVKDATAASPPVSDAAPS